MSENTHVPEIGGRLRKNILWLPEAIHQASGIVIKGEESEVLCLLQILPLFEIVMLMQCLRSTRLLRNRLSVTLLLKLPIFLCFVE